MNKTAIKTQIVIAESEGNYKVAKYLRKKLKRMK